MTDPTTHQLREVGRWLVRLMRQTERRPDERIDAEGMADLAQFLAARIPVEAFTTQSLGAVLENHRWFPAAASILEVVGGWWRDLEPAAPDLVEGPGGVALDQMDRLWLAYWHKRRAEMANTPMRGDPAQHPVANLASLVRDRSPRAWSIIAGGHSNGERMAG